MADSRVQLEAEYWVRTTWLFNKFHQVFRQEPLKLESGGDFVFDAVSEDHKIVASISTSSGITSGGKYPAAKVQKLRADMLFLLMIKAERRLIVLTEKNMYDLCLREMQQGRVPKEIEFLYAKLEEPLARKLIQARKIAADEVSPLR